ncbi:peroxiredoxin [Luteimonas sp. A277]
MNFFKTALLGFSLTLATACTQPAMAEESLQPGDRAPLFETPAWLAGEAFQFDMAAALAKGPVVLYFFPAANTPGCNLEASLFSQNIDRFAELGATVIGVTAGNTDQLQEFSADSSTCAGKFPVAADEGARIAADYRAVSEGSEYSSRTSYAIRQDGTIAAVHSDRNPNRHVQAMLEGLDVAE